jgi:hypothetical protein
LPGHSTGKPNKQDEHGICLACGQDHHGKCSAHRKGVRPLAPCTRVPNTGQKVCHYHGARKHGTKATRLLEMEREMERAQAKMVKAVETLGLPREIDPQKALLEEIARTAGHVQWLAGMVASLQPEEVVWGRDKEEHKEGNEAGDPVDYTLTARAARPHVWVQLYQQERAHLVHVCKVAITCGIQERQVKLAEEQGNLIAGILRQVFEDPELGLSEKQQLAGRMVASKHLRLIQGGGDAGASATVPLPRLVGHENGSS